MAGSRPEATANASPRRFDGSRLKSSGRSSRRASLRPLATPAEEEAAAREEDDEAAAPRPLSGAAEAAGDAEEVGRGGGGGGGGAPRGDALADGLDVAGARDGLEERHVGHDESRHHLLHLRVAARLEANRGGLDDADRPGVLLEGRASQELRLDDGGLLGLHPSVRVVDDEEHVLLVDEHGPVVLREGLDGHDLVRLRRERRQQKHKSSQALLR